MEERKPASRPPDRGSRNAFLKGLFLWILTGALLISFARLMSREGKVESIPYTQFLQSVRDGKVSGTLTVYKDENIITGTLSDSTKFKTIFPEDPDLYRTLSSSGIPFNVQPTSNIWPAILINTIPVALLILLLLWFLSRQMSSEGNRMMSFARSRPSLPGTRNRVTFSDVAGCEEPKNELREIIDFLKAPEKFQKLGGRIPKGVLLIGPPGTGKTLLARAVAGEADVPFLSMSGSDFVEMFVGVGAARVRDLFRQAKRSGRSIVFIDEIDAVGRQRFAGVGGGHDEREQTLNQLLVEMDGFQTDEGVILMAATNRPDVLDPALTRTGRFDRTVVINLPDIREREAILKVHTSKKPLDPSVNLQVLARATPGLSGADLANIVNEAALLSSRRDRDRIDMQAFEEAKDKVLMGIERRSLVISPQEKKVIAYHESGHTLVQKNLPDVYPVHKVTIIPRGTALGITHILPEKDHFIESDAYYLNSICSLLAGRVTERLVFGRLYTGSENDLKIATEIARKMVCEWGMSKKLGPVSFGQQEAVFLGRDLIQQKEHSEVTRREIDQEVRQILMDAERKAEEILAARRSTLDLLAETLLERETLSSDQIDEIIRGEETGHGPEEGGTGSPDDPGGDR